MLDFHCINQSAFPLCPHHTILFPFSFHPGTSETSLCRVEGWGRFPCWSHHEAVPAKNCFMVVSMTSLPWLSKRLQLILAWWRSLKHFFKTFSFQCSNLLAVVSRDRLGNPEESILKCLMDVCLWSPSPTPFHLLFPPLQLLTWCLRPCPVCDRGARGI